VKARRHKGFTVLEVTVASVLSVLLALLLSSAWMSVGKSIADLHARSQLAQEMDFAVAAISSDLGGWPANPQGQPVEAGSCTVDATNFVLTINLTNRDTITYQIDASNSDAWNHNDLIRTYHTAAQSQSQSFTVARNVDNFYPSINSDGTQLTLRIDFSCNYPPQSLVPTSADRENSLIKRTCVLVTNLPP
jgi:type II secretory pathway pseudopilin PulG